MSSQTIYCVSGVIKFDYKSAGYRDLLQVAHELRKDPYFQQIIIRFVSEKNLGIQFLYINEHYSRKEWEHKRDDNFPYLSQLKEQFGDGLYAHDIEYKSCLPEELKESIILSKDISHLLV